MRLANFQLKAIADLMEAMSGPRQEIVLKSCTGSGKTIILTRFIDEYGKSFFRKVFVWLTPGKGDLEEQSKTKMDKYIYGSHTKLLADVMTSGFEENDACFINWEKLTKKGNNALKDGERTNFLEHIRNAQNRGLTFVVIVDESHQNDTVKAADILQYFAPEKIITYTTPSGMKCRDIKLYDSKFLKEMMENEFKLRAEIIGRFEGAVPQADKSSGRCGALLDGDREELDGTARAAAVADSVAGRGSGGGNAAVNQGGTGGIPRPEGAGVGEVLPRNAIGDTEVPTGDGTVRSRNYEEPIVTGWENERKLFAESLLGAGADEKVHGYTVLDRADSVSGAGDIGTDLAYLSADIAGIIDENHRPQDSTTMRKPRQRKRALGQKTDEQDQNHGQRM